MWCGPSASPVVLPPDLAREAVIASLGAVIGVLICLLLSLLLRSEKMSVAAPAVAAAAQPLPAAYNIAPAALQSLLESRRSITPKDYTGAPVDDESVSSILAAAPWAPNHGKTEPWRFVVFGGERKQALLDATLEWHLSQPSSFWKGAYMSKGVPEFADGEAFARFFQQEAVAKKWSKASHLVAICLHRQRPSDKKRIPEWEEVCACACAVQNMHLKAVSLRIAAYWSSWYDLFRKSDECLRFLGLSPSDGDLCLGIFVLGSSTKLGQIRGKRQALTNVVDWR